MDENIDVLLQLHKLKKILINSSEKRTIDRLIKKRTSPFLINQKLEFDNKSLGRAKVVVHKLFNYELEVAFPVEEECYYDREYKDNFTRYKSIKDEKNSEIVSENRISGYQYENKNLWIVNTNEYKEALLIRAQLFLDSKNIFYKNIIQLLNIKNADTFRDLINTRLKNN